MQTTTQDAKQTVLPSLLQSLLPYLLAIVVLTALPQFVIAEDNPSGVLNGSGSSSTATLESFLSNLASNLQGSSSSGNIVATKV